jgi:hypothetical protein
MKSLHSQAQAASLELDVAMQGSDSQGILWPSFLMALRIAIANVATIGHRIMIPYMWAPFNAAFSSTTMST